MNMIANRKSDILARVYVGRNLVRTSGCKCAENKEVRNLLVRLDLPHVAGMHAGKELDNSTVENWTYHIQEEEDKLFPILRMVADKLPDAADKSILNGQINQLINEHNTVVRPLLKQNKVPPDSLVKEHGELEDRIIRKYKDEIIQVAKEHNLIDQPKIGVSGVLDENTSSHVGSGVKLVLGAAGSGILLAFGAPLLLVALPFVLGAGSSVADAVSGPAYGSGDSSKSSNNLFNDSLANSNSSNAKAQSSYSADQAKWSGTVSDAFDAFIPGTGAIAASIFDTETKNEGPKKWQTPDQKNRAEKEFKQLYTSGFVRNYDDSLDAGAEGWSDAIANQHNQFLSMPEQDKKTWLMFINWAYSNSKNPPPFHMTYAGLSQGELDKLALLWSEYTKVPVGKISSKLNEVHNNMVSSDYYRLSDNQGKALSVIIQNLRTLSA